VRSVAACDLADHLHGDVGDARGVTSLVAVTGAQVGLFCAPVHRLPVNR